MSQAPVDPAPTPEAPPATSPALLPVRIGLFVILGLFVVAYVMDRRAFDASEEAHDRVVKLSSDERFQDSLPSDEDVQAAVGFPPTQKHMPYGNDKVVDVYQWRRGLPFQSYDLYAVFSKTASGKYLFSTAFQNGLPGPNEVDVNEVTPEAGPVNEAPSDGTPPLGPPPPRPGATDPPADEGDSSPPMPAPSPEETNPE